MKISFRRKKSSNSRKSKPRKTNKPKRKTSSNNMARKMKTKTRRRSTNGGSGPFSGKFLGFKIPIVSNVMRNRTFQKAVAGAGIVSLGVSIAQLLNNPTVNRVANEPVARIVAAGAAGDVVGAGVEIARQGRIPGLSRTNGQTQMASGVGFA